MGINIFSGTRGLGGALTNPTALARRKQSIVNDYPVTIEGEEFIDAETAYQTLKRRTAKTLTVSEREALLLEMMTCKLKQHPRLTRAITKEGGVEWLETCSHHTGAHNATWEGDGTQSRFIRLLIAAYIATKEQA